MTDQPSGSRTPDRTEAGGAGLTALLGTVVLLAVALGAVAAITDAAVAAARASTAADAAALAGMSTSPLAGGRGEPGERARAIAAANGARMVTEDLRGWPLRYSVTVQVDPRSALVRRVTTGLSATAVAAVRPPGSALIRREALARGDRSGARGSPGRARTSGAGRRGGRSRLRHVVGRGRG